MSKFPLFLMLALGALCLAGMSGCSTTDGASCTRDASLAPSHRTFNAATGQWEEAPPYGPRRNATRG